jgi:hypothetical protein
MKTNLTICIIGLTALIAVASMDDDTRNNIAIKANAPESMKAEPGEYSRIMLQSESESSTGGVVCYHVYKLGVRFPSLRCFELSAGNLLEVVR